MYNLSLHDPRDPLPQRARGRVSVKDATDLAWDIIQLLERPGDELPELAAIRQACKNARTLAQVCDFLRQGHLFDIEPQEEELHLPDGAFIPPPRD